MQKMTAEKKSQPEINKAINYPSTTKDDGMGFKPKNECP